MSVKRDVWLLPRLRAQAVAPFLDALSPHFALAACFDLRLKLEIDGGLLALYPRPEGDAAAQLGDLRGRIAEAFEAAGRRAAELEGPLQAADIAGMPSLRDGLYDFIWSLCTPDSPDEAAASPTGLRVIIDSRMAAGGEAVFAELVRRSRDARFLVSSDKVTVLDLDDAAGRGAMVEGFIARGLPAGVTLLRRHAIAAISVWLPQGVNVPDGVRGLVTRLLNAMAEAGLLDRAGDLHLVPGADGRGLAIWLQAEATPEAGSDLTDVAQLAGMIAGPDQADDLGPALQFSVLHLRPDADALRALNERLNDRRFPLGYRISLAPVPGHLRGGDDIEWLRAEIDEREALIALIQALGRPQRRLLRFTDAQLPALVDGLRKMPRALREDRGLLYAAAHAAGRAEPAHYVLYDPDLVQFEGVLPEVYWRAVTEDQPIAFWLDPLAEEARDDRAEEPMVFVPQGHHILPGVDSFGSSVSGTLRLVLGNLFADASAVLEAPGARPAFVFLDLKGAPGRDAARGDEIGVELLDLSRFAPLTLSLRWINEHILASSPRVADPEARRELAESLYAGQLARALRDAAGGEVEALRLEWQQVQAELFDNLDTLTAAVTREVAEIQARLVSVRRFVDMSHARMAEVTGALNRLGAAVGAVDETLDQTAGTIPQLEQERIAFVARYLAEYRAGERLIDDASRDLTVLRARLRSLEEVMARE